jgi:hypothetical protein
MAFPVPPDGDGRDDEVQAEARAASIVTRDDRRNSRTTG